MLEYQKNLMFGYGLVAKTTKTIELKTRGHI